MKLSRGSKTVKQMQKFWNSAKTTSTAFQQYDDPGAPLSAVIKSFSDIIENDNQYPSTVMLKKQMVLLTDYIPVNVTEAMNALTSENEQKLGVFHELNLTTVRQAVNFPVYSCGDEIIPRFPKLVYQGKPINRERLFMMEFDSGTALQIVESSAAGNLCTLPSNKMLSDFVTVKFAHNGSVHELAIPFLGNQTTAFAQHCIQHLDEK
ncbi:hypothetical protein COOONC_06817, partial [Cooperia oncophora]